MNTIPNKNSSNDNFKLHIAQLEGYQKSNILLQDILILTCSDSSKEYKEFLTKRFKQELSVFTLVEFCSLTLSRFLDSIECQENLSSADQIRLQRLNIEIQKALHSHDETIKMMPLLFSQYVNHVQNSFATYQSVFVSELKSATQQEVAVVKMFESFFNCTFTTMSR